MGEAREQPRQRDLQPQRGLVDVDGAGGALAERLDAEAQAIVIPSLVLDRQQRCEFAVRTADPGLDAAQRLVLAEAVGNVDDERFRHRGVVSW